MKMACGNSIGNEKTSSTGGPNDPDSFVIKSYLDEVEDRVERLFNNLKGLLQEKDSLITVLSHLKEESTKCSIDDEDHQEILINIERLQKRCRNMEITIQTSRTSEQEVAFSAVNSLVKKLEHTCVLGNPDNGTYHQQVRSYFNACVSDTTVSGPMDYKFQGMILDCKLEDQKQVRHRLECLMKGRCHVDFIEKDFDTNYIVEDPLKPKNILEQEKTSSQNASSSKH